MLSGRVRDTRSNTRKKGKVLMLRSEMKSPKLLELSLRDVVAPLFRKKRVLAATFVVSAIVCLALGSMMPPVYRSEMSVLVNRERLDPPVTSEASSQLPMTSSSVTLDEINSEAELLRSHDLLRDVVIQAGLAGSAKKSIFSFHRRPQDPEASIAAAVNQLSHKLKIANTSNSDLIQVLYSASDPKLAHTVLETLGNLYLEKHVAVHRPPGSYEFFSREAERYRKALDVSEARLRQFGETQGIAAPDAVRADLASQLAGSIGQLHAAQEQIAADQERLRSDEQQMTSTPKRSATVQSLTPADKLLGDLHSTMLAEETKRAQLALKYDASYPLVQEADEEIAQTRAAIAKAEGTRYLTEATDRDPTYELLREDAAKAKADLAGQQANQQAIQRSIGSIKSAMVDMDHKSLDHEDLVRDAKANEENYLLYMSKREQARTSDALDKTRIANVSIAIPASEPAFPVYNFTLIVLAAMAFSAVLSVAVAYVADYLDPSFHTPAQVIEFLDIPVVVGMPRKTA